MSLSTTPPTKSYLYRGTGKPLTVTSSYAPAPPVKREVKSNLSTEPKNSAQVFKEVRNLFPKQEEIEPSNEETEYAALFQLIQTNLNLIEKQGSKIYSLE